MTYLDAGSRSYNSGRYEFHLMEPAFAFAFHSVGVSLLRPMLCAQENWMALGKRKERKHSEKGDKRILSACHHRREKQHWAVNAWKWRRPLLSRGRKSWLWSMGVEGASSQRMEMRRSWQQVYITTFLPLVAVVRTAKGQHLPYTRLHTESHTWVIPFCSSQ